MAYRCKKCIIPTAFPGVGFDSKGTCSLCLNHEKMAVHGPRRLEEIFHTRGRGKYDCVVPLSGGKDSSYILFYAVKKLRLRIIAVNYDSGFQSNIAKENIRRACRLLEVPLVIVKTDLTNHLKMLREIMHMSQLLRTFFGTCGNCEANIRTATLRVAKQYEIPFVLYGGSATEGMGKYSFFGLKGFVRKIGKMGLMDLIKLSFHAIWYCFYNVRQRSEMRIPLRYRFVPGQLLPLQFEVPFPRKRPTRVNFFEYLEYDIADKIKTLEKNLQWKSPSDRPHRFDCLLHCFVNHHWWQESGISLDGYNYSTMIRESLMNREDALLMEEIIENGLNKECLEALEKIGLREYDLPRIRAETITVSR
jgi:hypothetical protein